MGWRVSERGSVSVAGRAGNDSLNAGVSQTAKYLWPSLPSWRMAKIRSVKVAASIPAPLCGSRRSDVPVLIQTSRKSAFPAVRMPSYGKQEPLLWVHLRPHKMSCLVIHLHGWDPMQPSGHLCCPTPACLALQGWRAAGESFLCQCSHDCYLIFIHFLGHWLLPV